MGKNEVEAEAAVEFMRSPMQVEFASLPFFLQTLNRRNMGQISDCVQSWSFGGRVPGSAGVGYMIGTSLELVKDSATSLQSRISMVSINQPPTLG